MQYSATIRSKRKTHSDSNNSYFGRRLFLSPFTLCTTNSHIHTAPWCFCVVLVLAGLPVALAAHTENCTQRIESCSHAAIALWHWSKSAHKHSTLAQNTNMLACMYSIVDINIASSRLTLAPQMMKSTGAAGINTHQTRTSP